MLTVLFLRLKHEAAKLVGEEKAEGMVGWIVGALLTITIVTILHGAITGWLSVFWDSVELRIQSIV